MAKRAIVIGGGPAGLMAAEALLQAGIRVDLYDSMPSVGRKFLMAGRGGLNITHAEPMARFLPRFGAAQGTIGPWLDAFGPQALRDWVQSLGVDTFIGTSGRVFPAEMKAAPLLRAWLHRLRQQGLRIHVRHRWIGWQGDNAVSFETADGRVDATADAIVLALGGGSWPQLGSDGAWQSLLRDVGVELAPLEPANCGFDISWSDHLRGRFAGAALKNIAATFADERRLGEAIITESGVEGGLIYALSAPLRTAINRAGSAVLHLDLLPNHAIADITAALAKRGSRSLSSHLKSSLGLDAVKVALLHECLDAADRHDAGVIARRLKSLPLKLIRPRPISEAISSAGGVRFSTLNAQLMVTSRPGLFCAGEMLDWEAPTGGYLLTACLASGLVAGKGAAAWLNRPS